MSPQPLGGTTVLVTGGAGFVGSHIVDRLVETDAGEIRVLDNLSRGCRDNLAVATARRPITFILGDIRDRRLVGEAMRGCDYVFHQASLRVTQCAEQPRECMDTMVGGTFNVFEAAAEAGVKKVVYASSASIYGAANEFPTGEHHHPFNNQTIYGAAKLMNEGIARSFRAMYGLATVGLRYFNVYGPRMDTAGAYTEVLIRWLDSLAEGRRPQIHGDGSATMDFVYSGDVARANILALQSDESDAVYNVASGRETSLLQLWRAVQQAAGSFEVEPEFLPLRQVNPVPRRLADTRRARDELGFEAEVPLEEGLRRVVSWWREVTGKRGERPVA